MKNLTVEQWINDTIEESESDWIIAVFKAKGTFTDAGGVKRQVVSLKKQFHRSIAWAITASRRKLKCNEMRFVPFIGGSRSLGIAAHIHAFIEIPPSTDYQATRGILNNYWDVMPRRSFKTDVEPILWSEQLDKSRAKCHIYYCSRYENFIKGTDKVLFEMKSCLL
jgi:hypothetical protein